MLETLVIIAATVITVLCAFAQKRRHILAYSGTCGLLYLVYWLQAGHLTAAAMGAVGVFSVVVQFLVPEKHLEKTKTLRVGFVLVLAVIGFSISYQGINDILPLMAFTAGRMAEIFTKPASIRFGYIVNTNLWLAFSIVSGDNRAIAANTVSLCANLCSNAREYLSQQKLKLQAI